MDEGQIIIQEWGLDPDLLHSKEEILAALAARVEQMLLHDPMGFIGLMYRLDIAEARLDAALDTPDAPPNIATLIWDRQVQKSILRRSTPPREAGSDEDLAW